MFAGLSTFMPHSPRQLIRTGKIELAKKEFRRIHRDQSKGETEFGHREHEDGEGEREFELMRKRVYGCETHNGGGFFNVLEAEDTSPNSKNNNTTSSHTQNTAPSKTFSIPHPQSPYYTP